MTTTYYEERLRTFSKGKRLGRLAKAVRDPEDGSCDACGSTLPRTLFGLRDTESDRHSISFEKIMYGLCLSNVV